MKRAELKAGDRFGKWTVLKILNNVNALCKCDCGTVKEVNIGNLLQGFTKSCGRCRKVQIGDKYGEWTIIDIIDNLYAMCRCSCGKEKKVYVYSLLKGKSVSCGCIKSKRKIAENDSKFVGKKFGEWTVLKILQEGYAACRCSCGTIKNVKLTTLTRGLSISCGCKRMDGRQKQAEATIAQGKQIVADIHAEGLAVKYLGRKTNKNSGTGITGVCLTKNRKTGEEMYRAYITVNRKQIPLGVYDDISKAIAVRKEAEKKYFAPLQEKVNAIKNESLCKIKQMQGRKGVQETNNRQCKKLIDD